MILPSSIARETIDTEGLRRLLKGYRMAHPDLTTSQLVISISEDMKKHGSRLPGRPAGKAGKRYVLIRGEMLIDLMHFFAAARVSGLAGHEITNVLGWGLEIKQALEGKSGGHPFGGNEDLRSNAAGAEFGWYYIDDEKDFEDNVVDYLEARYGSPPQSSKSEEEPIREED